MTGQPTNCLRGELRLSALDESFLGLEPAHAEMHVGRTAGPHSAAWEHAGIPRPRSAFIPNTRWLPALMTGRFEIVGREDFSDVTFLLRVFHPRMAKVAKPGQFVIVMEHDRGERIPLTLADLDDLIARLRRFAASERAALERRQESCGVAVGG